MNSSVLLVRLRFVLQAGFDATCWLTAMVAATLLRYDFQTKRIDLAALVVISLLAAAGQVIIGRLVGLYIHRWRYGTFEEVAAAAASAGGRSAVSALGCPWSLAVAPICRKKARRSQWASRYPLHVPVSQPVICPSVSRSAWNVALSGSTTVSGL